MSDDPSTVEKRNLPILTGQSTFAQAAWTMGSPSIVLTFLAVSLELPVLLVGAFVTIRQVAGTLVDIFGVGSVSGVRNRKLSLWLSNLALAACFILASAAAVSGNKPVIMVTFAVVMFVIGLVVEVQTLMLTDFIGDNLRSKSRMRMQYTQMALGGTIAIALTWIAHKLTLEMEPIHRHSIVILIATACFLIAGFSLLAVRDIGSQARPRTGSARSPVKVFLEYVNNARDMLAQSWFRGFMLLRLLFVTVMLSVPFFALISAEAHHTSKQGLTALIVSSAAGAIVAGPLWRALNGFSHRMVMVTSTGLVALTGFGLITAHFLGLDTAVHVHAVALFVITVATTGLSTVRGLYFMDIAPADQRVRGVAVSRSFSRILAVAISALLAAIAHAQETVWAVAFIACVSTLAAAMSFLLVRTVHEKDAPVASE